MNLSLGFSPCPNDTFIFNALVNKKIDTGRFTFDIQLEDVQTLNQWAIAGNLDITKLSFGVLPLVEENYRLLDSGSALGMGVGPLLISKNELTDDDIANCTVLIPGEHTTAHMLFSTAFPKVKNKTFVRYNEIEKQLLNSENKDLAGVIIHENRFTYQQKGLKLIRDLGNFWEEKTGLPIPLGGIVAKKSLGNDVIFELETLIKKSLDYSWKAYPQLSEFITTNAQEMSEDIMRKHIELYVNDYTKSLGKAGTKAIDAFRKVHAQRAGDISSSVTGQPG